jgi:hypothetical protein
MTAELHLAEDALTLHLLLESAESLVDIVVANENLHVKRPSLAVDPIMRAGDSTQMRRSKVRADSRIHVACPRHESVKMTALRAIPASPA